MRWQGWSLRSRLMALGIGGLAIGFALGALGLVAALNFALRQNTDRQALATARDIAVLVDAQAVPEPLPVSSGQIVQVIDAQGRVRAGSVSADRLTPLLRPAELAAARRGDRSYVDGERIGLAGPVRMVALPAGPDGDPQTVGVATPVAEQRPSVA